MPTLGRRGFTLVELMVAIVLLGIVSAGIYKVLVTNQQTYLAQTQRIDLQQNIRAAATILPAELRELDATDGDITAMSTNSITIRAMRSLAITCDPPPLGGGLGGIAMTIRQRPFFGRQLNKDSDQLLIYYEGDEGSRADDSWVTASITDISTTTCPVDNALAWRITMNPSFIAGQLNQVGAIQNGAPTRGFTSVTYYVYQASDGKWYLGLKDYTNATQPLIGPLIGSNGVTFTYYDAAGAVTAVPTAVATIEIRMRGQTASPIRQANTPGVRYKVDSVVTRVALRNNVRFNGN